MQQQQVSIDILGYDVNIESGGKIIDHPSKTKTKHKKQPPQKSSSSSSSSTPSLL
jgi:hypothetical protein